MTGNPRAQEVEEVTLTEEDPCSGGVCRERLCGRMKRELRFLSFLAEEDLEEVKGYFECRQLPAGRALWETGDGSTFAAFVISGRVQVLKKTELGEHSIVLGIFSQGAVLGETSLLDGSPREETAVVLDHADFILLTRESYRRLQAEHPRLAIRLLEGILATISHRLSRAYSRLASIF